MLREIRTLDLFLFKPWILENCNIYEDFLLIFNVKLFWGLFSYNSIVLNIL